MVSRKFDHGYARIGHPIIRPFTEDREARKGRGPPWSLCFLRDLLFKSGSESGGLRGFRRLGLIRVHPRNPWPNFSQSWECLLPVSEETKRPPETVKL